MKKALFVAVFLSCGLILAKNSESFWLIITTNTPLPHMVANLDEQVACARKAGFVMNKPTIRTMRSEYLSVTSSGYTYYPDGLAYMHLNIILLAPQASYHTLAHEMGHIIDFQTQRRGHPFFVGKETINIQYMADLIKDEILRECGYK